LLGHSAIAGGFIWNGLSALTTAEAKYETKTSEPSGQHVDVGHRRQSGSRSRDREVLARDINACRRMNPAECDTAHGTSAGCGAQAQLPRLPRLKKDNCIINGRHRSVFIAQENIRLYSWKFGERNVGVLTVTAADTLKSSDFQKKWHSFINSLRKLFPTGMWVRERQPRSGNWHAHAVVNAGWDIRVPDQIGVKISSKDVGVTALS